MPLIKGKKKLLLHSVSRMENDEGSAAAAGLKNISPAIVNELITLTKESAIVTVIGLGDVMRRAYQAAPPLTITLSRSLSRD